MKKMTLFTRINWIYSNCEVTIDEIISIIRDGTFPVENKSADYRTTLKEITENLQHGLLYGIPLQDMKREYLPAVSFNGTFKSGLITQYSDVTALDFDHIPDQAAFTSLYYKLMATPCVRNIYRTPSGKGLKAIILHDNQVPGLHGNLYRQLLAMFKTEFICADPKCGDLFRRNYICYDQDVWTNPFPVPYHFAFNSEYDKPVYGFLQGIVRDKDTSGLPSDASVMNLLKYRCRHYHPEYLREGFRRDGVYWFGTQSSRAGVEYVYGLEFVKDLYMGKEIILTHGGEFSEDEIAMNYLAGYKSQLYDETFRASFRR